MLLLFWGGGDWTSVLRLQVLLAALDELVSYLGSPSCTPAKGQYVLESWAGWWIRSKVPDSGGTLNDLIINPTLWSGPLPPKLGRSQAVWAPLPLGSAKFNTNEAVAAQAHGGFVLARRSEAELATQNCNQTADALVKSGINPQQDYLFVAE
ncbi:hypothetical protein V6N11_040124 [Hibiscus sabdariffa]|uniref:Uncharacterized protein n=1 Tax=Hibiscus sabdariffa TaxID=183260 RepID=A0ABR2RGY7_9ROSI